MRLLAQAGGKKMADKSKETPHICALIFDEAQTNSSHLKTNNEFKQQK